MDYIVVLITVPDFETGKKIAKALVEEKLGACVNITTAEVNSIYYWKGNIEDDNENLLIIKTRKDKFESLVNKVKELHPYTVPEIIALPIVVGSEDYLNWIDETLDRE